MNRVEVTPPIKWIGGKRQLLDEIRRYYPFEPYKITKYVEPFVGGGAVLFDILSKYTLDFIYINDINKELITMYCVIRDNLQELLELLKQYIYEFNTADNDKKRSDIYYKNRSEFNRLKSTVTKDNIRVAALLIFLNRTCYNGLYRVNKQNEYNAAFNKCTFIKIDYPNLKQVSEKLKYVHIICDTYKASKDFIDDNTFVYLDPPYIPVSKTANFTSYTKEKFNLDSQKELATFIQYIDKQLHAKILLSNAYSNTICNLYSDYIIHTVKAYRAVNIDTSNRGKVDEVLISNFEPMNLSRTKHRLF